MRIRTVPKYQSIEECLAVDQVTWLKQVETLRSEAREEMQLATARSEPDSAEHWRVFAEIVELDPRDWHPYGFLDREQPHTFGPDCSVGCAFYVPLSGDFGADWGVCLNPSSHRAGRLTFERQGCNAFEFKSE
jgi:hypothetical protein